MSALPLGLSGCLTNFGNSVRMLAGGEGLEQESPLAGNNSNSSLITLTRVLRSTQNPTANLDLHGDGSNAFGQYCIAPGGGGGGGAGGTGPSTCACNYTFTLPDGTTQDFDVDTIYREDNMIRCPYTSIPAEVTQMQVRVHLLNVDVYSNAITFRFTGAGISASPVDSSTYLPVIRYQCKQALYVPHALDTRVIDPFLSGDGIFALLIDFHTTNLGRAIAHFANPERGAFDGDHAERGWVCPTTPNDSSFGADLTVYSVAPDSSGNRRIFPPTDPNLDRATFYLAKEMTGVFTVPFNTYSIPFEPTETPREAGAGSTRGAERLPPIGYGAAPIRNTIDGEESCPGADAPIPSGFRWVKVWSFRATIMRPAYPTAASLQGIRGISCNPGLMNVEDGEGILRSRAAVPACGSVRQQMGLAPGTGVVAGCNLANRVSLTSGNATGSTIADRVIWDSTGSSEAAACAKINPGGTTDNTGNLFTTYGALSLGADTWRRYNRIVDSVAPNGQPICDRNTISGSRHHDLIDDLVPGNFSAPAVAPEDCSSPFNVLNLCGSYGSQGLLSDPNPHQNLVIYPADSARRAPASEAAPDWSAPYDTASGGAVIDATPLQDFLYVVTPTNVMTHHMLDPSETGVGAVYRPYRFYASGDCSSADPTSPGLRPDGTPDCPSSRRITYRFVNRDQSVSDPSQTGDDPNVVRGYPICALQPIRP